MLGADRAQTHAGGEMYKPMYQVQRIGDFAIEISGPVLTSFAKLPVLLTAKRTSMADSEIISRLGAQSGSLLFLWPLRLPKPMPAWGG